MLIWMIDSLLLYRKVKAGLVPPNLLISHGIPVSSGSNPEVVTTQIKKGQDQPRTQRKKKRKKKQKKNGKRELPLRILPRRIRLLTSLHRKKARMAWLTATKHTLRFKFSEN